MKSKIAVFTAPNNPITLNETHFSGLKEGELLVKMRCATICGSDIHTLKGIRKEPAPTVLGHEIVGEVVDIHPETIPEDLYGKVINIGDRITWTIYASCGKCEMCLKGMPQKCEFLFKYGHQCILNPDHVLSGGYANYVKIEKGTGIIKIEGSIPDYLISQVNCATATISAAFSRVPSPNGKTVLIVGGGMLGITACAMAKAKGAKNVFLVEKNSFRAELSYNFGVNRAFILTNEYDVISEEIKNDTDNKLIDIIIETSGKKEAIEFGVNNLAIGGHLALVGSAYPQPNISISAEYLLRRLATIHGVHNYTANDLKTAYEFMIENYKKYPFEKCVYQDMFKLENINEAFNVAMDEKFLRVAIIGS